MRAYGTLTQRMRPLKWKRRGPPVACLPLASSSVSDASGSSFPNLVHMSRSRSQYSSFLRSSFSAAVGLTRRAPVSGFTQGTASDSTWCAASAASSLSRACSVLIRSTFHHS